MDTLVSVFYCLFMFGEMIFLHLFSNNFLKTFSVILTLCFYSLSSFFFLYCF